MAKKRFAIWRMEFLHPAMWHVALESWQWIHQVAAPCNVIRGSGMTCHWIRPNVCHILNCTLTVPSYWWATISARYTCLVSPVLLSSFYIFHYVFYERIKWMDGWMDIGILHLISISITSPQSTCHYAPVSEILSKSDHLRQKKWRNVDFQEGGSQPS